MASGWVFLVRVVTVLLVVNPVVGVTVATAGRCAILVAAGSGSGWKPTAGATDRAAHKAANRVPVFLHRRIMATVVVAFL